MKSFVPQYIENISIPVDLSILLNSCAKAQGKEQLWEKIKPEVLNVLRSQAIISSTESSNRIEGVEVKSERLKLLVEGESKPLDRPEEEVLGYKNALNWIHENAVSVEINPDTIKKIHQLAQEGAISDAGAWKVKNNEIIEIHTDGNVTVRFVPPEPKDVSKLIQDLCFAYNEAINKKRLPELLLVASFVFDFLCIHPFRDGNGRVSRLLTQLLLCQQGYNLGRYISIEKIIEDTKESYYQTLKESSKSWHTSEHSLIPFWKYFVETLKVAYDRLEDKFGVEESFHGGKTQLIRNAVLRQIGNFKLGDIINQEPGISQNLIQKVLAKMRDEDLVELHGHGRGAYWKKK
ncbi:MAG: Fic family protein [Bdellovibrionota bacterium]